MASFSFSFSLKTVVFCSVNNVYASSTDSLPEHDENTLNSLITTVFRGSCVATHSSKFLSTTGHQLVERISPVVSPIAACACSETWTYSV